MSAPTIDATSASARPASELVLPPIKWHAPITYAAVALLGLVVFGLLAPTGEHSTFAVSTTRDFIQFTPFSVPS